MAYLLSNICTKNYWNRTTTVEIIIAVGWYPFLETQCRAHPLPFPKLHPGPCSSVGMRRETDRQTHRWPWSIYISPQLHLTRNL